ncbi:MBL fold metallo-hydrolase RNA specificity domain-containing protein [Acetonema longum]|uniref:RNA-metabolising metallo-beta-lactamase n=1 Tax=Acetonema longum DSM 6540 TaxID=1009370 RepID=F7NQ51_9FIRM|nr:MBL fold metallo-hydrolase [Acetonema longum]EGO61810.1 RNA-metabolising metallo-beta-lactamase [Acetonema longum DSM 6540]
MQLTFLGAAMMVTGSAFLLETGRHRGLVDCGMFQGSKEIEALNRRPFPFDPKTIDFVLLTHAHIDHSGLLPRLCKSGFKGPIYATPVTAALCGIMLPDSAHIQEYDAEVANRKGQRAGRKALQEPLYTVQEAYECLKQFVTVEYDREFALNDEIIFQFRDAGHILGSSMIELWVNETNDEKGRSKYLFSGDIGQPDQPILKNPTCIDSADFVIMESTYGNRLHEGQAKEEALAQIINDTYAAGGNVVIPAFAVGRTQTLLYYLRQFFKEKKIPDMPVIVDSPMAVSATDIFLGHPQEYDAESQAILSGNEHPFKMPNLVFAKSSDESKAINSMNEPVIIISASGMADAGRILHHLKHNLWRPESSVVLVGYQAQGSMGRRLLEGVRRVKIMGEQISVRAKIHNLDGFSAHADRQQLLDWLSCLQSPPVNIFMVHGEPDMSEPFARIVQGKFGYPCFVPRYGDAAVCQGRKWSLQESDAAVVNPDIRRLQEQISLIEANYREYRRRIERLLVSDSDKASDIVKRLAKVDSFIRQTFDDL